MKRLATLDSIDTYANTVDFLIKNFSNKEFTSKEYNEKRDHAANIFTFGTVKEYSPQVTYRWGEDAIDENDLVYRTRVEEFIVPHDEDEDAVVGKRYYYRISPKISDAVAVQKKALAKQLKEGKWYDDVPSIAQTEERIRTLHEQLDGAKKRLAKMKEIVKEYGE